jgi:hypothetical protein
MNITRTSRIPLTLLLLFFRVLEEPHHPINKSSQKCRTDKDDQVGGKKGHDERERIFEPVGGDENGDAKIDEKAGSQYEGDLASPPKND